MPDTFDANGLTTKTLTELRTELETSLKAIYGNDINVDQDSPDGQSINIYAQGGVDIREVLEKVNAGFDPDQAEGRVLDQRVGINGISRDSGSYTIQPIEITTDTALNLVGLEAQATELNPTIVNLYTVKDDAGTLFYLVNDQTIVGAGTFTFDFRAAPLGKVETVPNTITTPVTIISGVTGINNPANATTVGQDEETDFDLKIRRRESVSLPAVGPLDAIQAAIANLDNVVAAFSFENETDVIDGDGIPAHGIWVIVDGGADQEIGDTIYLKRPPGTDMKGTEATVVTRADGVSTFTVNWDRPILDDLYIQFSLTLPGGFIDADEIKQQIVDNVLWSIGGSANASTITAFVQSLNSRYVIENMEVSDDDITYVETLAAQTKQHRWVNDIARITIT